MDKNIKILTPTRTGNFLLTSMDREFYATRCMIGEVNEVAVHVISI